MRRVLGADKALYFDTLFPSQSKKKSLFAHRAVIGIGGNLGNVKQRFKRLILWLRKHPLIHVKQSAPIFENPPFGFLTQPNFYNTIVELETNLTPRKLLHFLLQTEKRFGRVRTFKNAPRTLDLDIIFYDDLNYKDKLLQIPHPQWNNRDSVLIPLSYFYKRRVR